MSTLPKAAGAGTRRCGHCADPLRPEGAARVFLTMPWVQVGSTALGQGVAIPHARIGGIDRPLTLYMRPKQAIAFVHRMASRSRRSS